jgi:Nucleotidyl transferase AbiEii toxin, Type IV TA system
LSNLPLEQRPNPTAWDELLQRALPALDHVFPPASFDKNRRPDWTLGGGTAIALRIAHRLSDDIDIFVPSQPLKAFTPAKNPGSRAISERFQWPGHFLRFECKEGEIDFLSPHLQSDPGFTWERYRNREVALETLEEVIVKKIRYRSARFTARDVFDLAAVARAAPAIVEVLASEVADALPRLKAVIQADPVSKGLLRSELRPTKEFEDLVTIAHDSAIRIVDAAIEAGRRSTGDRDG